MLVVQASCHPVQAQAVREIVSREQTGGRRQVTFWSQNKPEVFPEHLRGLVHHFVPLRQSRLLVRHEPGFNHQCGPGLAEGFPPGGIRVAFVQRCFRVDRIAGQDHEDLGKRYIGITYCHALIVPAARGPCHRQFWTGALRFGMPMVAGTLNSMTVPG